MNSCKALTKPKEQAKPVENLAAAENQLKSIEKDIKALGPVNVDAIEQYDEVKGALISFPASGGCLGCEKYASVYHQRHE